MKKRKLSALWRKYRKYCYTLINIICSIIGLLIILLIILFLFTTVKTHIEKKYLYSIPMPEWTGNFSISKGQVAINGIENIVGEETAGLGYSELFCVLKNNACYETRIAFINIRGVSAFPYSKEYIIKYKDENKLLFSDYTGNINGEIDLNARTLSYTIKKAGLDLTPRKVEIVTDNEKIKKLEKHIIRKYLRK